MCEAAVHEHIGITEFNTDNELGMNDKLKGKTVWSQENSYLQYETR